MTFLFPRRLFRGFGRPRLWNRRRYARVVDTDSHPIGAVAGFRGANVTPSDRLLIPGTIVPIVGEGRR